MREVATRWAGRSSALSGRSSFMRATGFVAGAVTLLVLWPLGVAVARLFAPGGQVDLSAFQRVFQQADIWSVVTNTAIVVAVSTGLALTVGCLFAWLNERTDAGMGWVSRVLPVVPLLVPPIAGAIGWIFLAAPSAGLLNGAIRGSAALIGVDLGTTGPLNIRSWYGLVYVYTLYLVPQVYLVVSAALRNLDPSLEEAARMSGSSPWRTIREVTMPAVKPAIAGGALLALVYGFALFSVPIIIGTQARIEVISVRIVRLLTASFPARLDEALALGAVLVVIIGAMWLIQWRVTRSARHATIGGRASSVSLVRLGVWRGPARILMLLYLAATSVLPFAALVFVSLQGFWSPSVNWSALSVDNYIGLWETSMARQALGNSVLLGIATATVGMLLALLIGVYVQRRRSTLARVADGATKLPGAVSNMVVAVAILATFAGPPFRLHGTILILLLAYLTLYLPQSTVNANSALSQVGRDLTEASLMSGSSEWRTFGRVTVPLTVPGVAAGWAFLFVLASGDVTASAILAGTNNPVIGFVVLDMFNSATYPTLAALAAIIAVVATVLVGSVLLLTGRRTDRRRRR